MSWKRSKALLRAAVGISCTALIVTPVSAGADADPPGEAVVEMLGLRYFPARLEIRTGTAVTWDNREPIDYPVIGGGHEILSEYYGAFESPDIAPGTRWTHRFDLPGTYRYRCKRHVGSTGQIVVTGEPVAEADARETSRPSPDGN